MGGLVTYLRVSTSQQGKSGLGIEPNVRPWLGSPRPKGWTSSPSTWRSRRVRVLTPLTGVPSSRQP